MRFEGGLRTKSFAELEKNLKVTLPEKCPYKEFFLVRIFLYSEWIRRFTDSIRIQSEYSKIRIRKNSVFGHFSRSVKMAKRNHIWIVIERSFSLNILLGVFLEFPADVFNKIDTYVIRFFHSRAKVKTTYFTCEWMTR